MAELNLSPVKGRTGQSRSTGKATQKPFVPGHRKCKSDGHNIFLSCSGGGSSSKSGVCADELSSWASGTLSSGTPSEECFRQHNLIDDSLVEDPCSSCQGAASDSGSARSGSIDLRRSRTLGKEGSKQQLLSPLSDSVKLPGLSATSPVGTSCSFQGCVKRKTLIKDGRRPTMSGWQRYWLQLWGRQLVFFLPRTLVTKGMERRDFKTEPCKCQGVEGWVVMVPDSGLGATDELSFQLADPSRRSVYRFRAPSPDLARVWVRCLHEAAIGGQQEQTQQLPANLISFE